MKVGIALVPLLTLALAAVASAQTRVSGTTVCAKPDQQTFEVAGHPGRALSLSQSRCTWSKPMEMAGSATKDDVVTVSIDIRGSKGRTHGYVVSTLASGDKFLARLDGTATFQDDVVSTDNGKWTLMGGTGKLNGATGGGTYRGKAGPEGVTFEFEGEYRLPAK
jgi:hypothetical protein